MHPYMILGLSFLCVSNIELGSVYKVVLRWQLKTNSQSKLNNPESTDTKY